MEKKKKTTLSIFISRSVDCYQRIENSGLEGVEWGSGGAKAALGRSS